MIDGLVLSVFCIAFYCKTFLIKYNKIKSKVIYQGLSKLVLTAMSVFYWVGQGWDLGWLPFDFIFFFLEKLPLYGGCGWVYLYSFIYRLEQ